MQVPLAVLADYANVTADFKLNISGIFNMISAATLPTAHPRMYLVMQFLLEPAERGQTKTIEIKLLEADGKQLLSIPQTVPLPEDAPLNLVLPQIVELNGIIFAQYGEYAFYILVNGEQKARVPFVVVAPPPQQGS